MDIYVKYKINMEIEWTNLARTEFGDRLDQIIKAAKGLRWERVPQSMPFSQGYAIKSVIREFKMPRVDMVAYQGAGPIGDSKDREAAYSLFGVQANYQDGPTRVLFVDKGTELVPLGRII